ncbi:ABC transporter permease [Egicoccus sp. AB-alg2]|uniref:ABC transporter permease n=1 Tax=Egicoccus sp. AB-alg2 TaxID=3242693 RepID=UPI00359DA5C4
MAFLDYLADPSTRDVLIQQTLEHVVLVVVPLLLALVVSLGLGIAAHRVPRLRAPILTTVSTFLTIPSLALFALFLPVMGIGDGAVMVALTLYALLPIVRNTVAGLGGVDPAIVEAARGMGMSGTKRLVRIELPTAWPVILAGIRVSTLMITGIAAIAALVGGSGLGQEIYRGIRRIGSAGALESLLGGTLAIVLLALLFDLFYLGLGRLTISRGLRD